MRSTARLLSRAERYAYRAPEMQVDHLVVGGGVIGLAVAARLTSRFKEKTTYLVERHAQIGQETSSRNSEVIHAGIYYPSDSLKSRFCIRGRDMLYERCEALGIGYKKCQKLIVATDNDQIQYLDRLHDFTQSPDLLPHLYHSTRGSGSGSSPANSAITTGEAVPTYFLGPNEARELEPDLGPNVRAAMLSTETGIVDAHGLMESLEREIKGDLAAGGEEMGNGHVVLGTKVVRVDPWYGDSPGATDIKGWVVQTLTEGSSQPDTLLAKVLVLSAGLSCTHLLNPLLPAREQLTPYYSKGSYLSYKGPGVANVQRLLYPCPQAGLAGLGTHLTLDLAGKIKFGPDVEHIEAPPDRDDDPDWWVQHLQPSEERIEEMHAAIVDYLPGVDIAGLTPDYAGIRPNLSPPGSGFTDFHVSYDAVARPGLIGLCGFNSPGLTSSLAIGEAVEQMCRRDVWGIGSGRAGRRVSEVGGEGLDGWA